MVPAPFVVGQWVRGDSFYGREVLIEGILDGPRNGVWLLGARRIGKTSCLKQIEHLTTADPGRGYLPLFWDFQGAQDARELSIGFDEALLDAEEALEQNGVSLHEIEADDLFGKLGRLRRRLHTRGLRLLLLCDEVEELIELRRRDPALLRKLRRALLASEEMRCVLASSVRLWALGERIEDTSPFLHGFTPPIYLRGLSDDEARTLICQTKLPEVSRPGFDDATVERIREHCDNHPYLLQLVCQRCLELGEVDDAVEDVAQESSVGHFFATDFELLSPTERNIVRIVARRSPSSSDSIAQSLTIDRGSLGEGLHQLEHLGYLRRQADRSYKLASPFFARWMRDHEGSDTPARNRRAGRVSDEATVIEGLDFGLIEDRYELLREVGRGANGRVFQARDRLLDVSVAVKLLRREVATRHEAIERLRREIRLARDIGHPNVLRIYHFGSFRDCPYVTMQWVDGPTLAERLGREGALDEEEVLAIGVKLASALAAAHGRGILHRDVKPQNILLDATNEPFLGDFGLARLQGEPGMTHGGVFLGTPKYASPEQSRLLPLDERSDLYSLGLVLFEMATGQPAFSAPSTEEFLEMHRNEPPPDPRAIRPGLSIMLAGAILRCLRKRPEERFQTAEGLRAALESISLRGSET